MQINQSGLLKVTFNIRYVCFFNLKTEIYLLTHLSLKHLFNIYLIDFNSFYKKQCFLIS